jgi:hypothetical protein
MSDTATLTAALRILARDIHCEDGIANQCITEAADMLEFLLGQMRSHSLQMDGTAGYRLPSGWPMTHAKGRNAEEAVRAAMREAMRANAR